MLNIRRTPLPRTGACRVGMPLAAMREFPENSEPALHLAAIQRSGGTPCLLTPNGQSPKALLSTVDALLIRGGGDVDPTLYQAADSGRCRGVNPGYDAFEVALIREAFAQKLPMLGVCRGQQIINVAGGGGLIQDLPTEYPTPDGRPVNHAGVWHDITIAPGSKLAELLRRTRATVISTHHQAVAMTHLSPLFAVTAQALDGVVEGIQRKDCAMQLGVQFHPEMMMQQDPGVQAIYDNLIENGLRARSTREP